MERLKKYHKVLNRCALILLAVMGSFFVKCPEIQAAPKAPAKAIIKTVSSPSEGKLKVVWKKVPKASGYQIQIAQNAKFTRARQGKVVSAKKRSLIITDLAPEKKYYVRVRAYKSGRNKKYGSWSAVRNTVVKKTLPEKVEIETAENVDGYELEVAWKRVSKASGYQVQLAVDKKFTIDKQTEEVSAKNGSYTFYDLIGGQIYYVRTRAYISRNGKKNYGDWSDTRRVFMEEGYENLDPTEKPQDPTISPEEPKDPTPTEPETTEDPKDPTEGTVKDLSSSGFTVQINTSGEDHTYTGKAIEPKVRVYDGKRYLIKDRDYTVTYSDNINAGQATVTIQGIGSYRGTLTGNFEIKKAEQSFLARVEDDIIYVGKTEKIDLSEAYGDLEFEVSEDGIVEISSDGTVTGIKPGKVFVTIYASGDQNHDAGRGVVVGYLTVLNGEASEYGFDSYTDYYKKEMINSRNSDGTNTYTTYFYCDAVEKWIDEEIVFTVEDVTPIAYARMYAEMGVAYSAPEMEVSSAKEHLDHMRRDISNISTIRY